MNIAYYNSPMGILEIKEEDGFVCSILFSKAYQNPFSDYSEIIALCCKELTEYFKGRLTHFTVPVKQKGTDFQSRVWNNLVSIPFGKTTSYQELAKRMGDTKLIRAVGGANGRNKISIIVPCHRVIGKNRKLVGYAGGLQRKQWLLEHEAKHAHGVQTLF